MKLQAERIEGLNAIARHGPHGVIVNQVETTRSVVVPWRGAVVPWPPESFEALSEAHFAALLEWKPELVVFGSGARLRFPSPALWRPLISQRVGFEAMDTAAACRTYNVLLAEGRAVLAALLFEEVPDVV